LNYYREEEKIYARDEYLQRLSFKETETPKKE
jgi:hypothetical protein